MKKNKTKLKYEAISLHRLVALRRKWLKRAKEYRTGKHWILTDEHSMIVRDCQADAIEDCASELRVEYS